MVVKKGRKVVRFDTTCIYTILGLGLLQVL
jgi:hypothetical protein